MWDWNKIGSRVNNIWSRQGFYKEFQYDIDLWPWIMILGHCIFFIQRLYFGEEWNRLGQQEKIYGLDKYFTHRSTVTLIVDSENLFKGHCISFTPKYSVGEV